MTLSAADAPNGSALESPELRLLFHRLNNELGIILAHAELLEAKALDEPNRGRARHVVSSVLNAMSTVREIRERGRAERATSTTPVV
jgi:hypothetical protein